MARSRNIKHSFFRDAKVVSVSFEARLLFLGMWGLADYKGRFKYVPIELKMEIFPADNVDIEKCVEELHSSKLIDIYHDNSGSTLVQVVNFEKHQNPHINEKQNKDKSPAQHLPSKNECDQNQSEQPVKNQTVVETTKVVPECSGSDPADSCFLIPDSLNADSFQPDSCTLIPDAGEKLLSSKLDELDLIIDYLNEKSGKRFKPVETNRKFIRARLKEGATVNEIKDVIDRKIEEWGNDPKMAKYIRPATLFNNEKFNQYVGELGVETPVQKSERELDEWANKP